MTHTNTQLLTFEEIETIEEEAEDITYGGEDAPDEF